MLWKKSVSFCLLLLLTFTKGGGEGGRRGEDEDVCFDSDITWDHLDQIEIKVGIESGRMCQKRCEDSANCTAFTWNTDAHPNLPRVCILFDATSNQLDCTNCLSGPPSCVCSSDYACNIVGDNIIDIIAPVDNEVECQTKCKDGNSCKMYTWFGDGDDNQLWKSTCMLFQKCKATAQDHTCSDCHTGAPSCVDSGAITSTTPFSLTIVTGVILLHHVLFIVTRVILLY